LFTGCEAIARLSFERGGGDSSCKHLGLFLHSKRSIKSDPENEHWSDGDEMILTLTDLTSITGYAYRIKV
jgi:hypothetical protein